MKPSVLLPEKSLFSAEQLASIEATDLVIANRIIAALREEVARLRRQLFGSSSEKLEVEGTTLTLLEESEPKADKPAATPQEAPQEAPQAEPQPQEEPKKEKKERKPSATRRLQLDLTKIKTETIELLPAVVREHPELYRRLPESADVVTPRLRCIPAKLQLNLYRRPKFVRLGATGAQAAPIMAPAPANVMRGSIIDESILALLVHYKYTLHVPAYRFVNELKRMGLTGLTEDYLYHWLKAAAAWLEPLWKLQHERVLGSSALHIDETPIQALYNGKSKGYMWCMLDVASRRPFYYWSNTRKAETLDTLLSQVMEIGNPAYSGSIVSDGYAGYDSWLKTHPVAHQACLTHIRRKFVDAMKAGNSQKWCEELIRSLQPLYAMEKELRAQNAPPEEILRRREETAKPIIDSFYARLRERAVAKPAPINLLAKAIKYALNQEAELRTYLTHPEVVPDNNPVERAIRPVTIGRKNYLFIGSEKSGCSSAILYTLVEECKRCKQDPLIWLNEAMSAMLHHDTATYDDVMPKQVQD